MRDLSRREPPAGAGNFLRREVDVLLEPHQLPVAGTRAEDETGFARQRHHGLVGAQRVAEQALGAGRCGAALQISYQRRTDAMPMPAVLDRQAELATYCIGIEAVAGFADDRLEAVDRHRGDHAEAVALPRVNEMVEQG